MDQSERGQRLLVSVAHPDDESFGTGSLLAHAAARRVSVVVSCASWGEAGDAEGDLGADGVAQVREAELRAAARLLGVDDVRLLDLGDSGMSGTPGPGTIAGVGIEAVTGQLIELIEEIRPTVVVTLDASDGHRDHAVIRDATLLAVDRAGWQVDRVYLSCLPQTLMARWVGHLRASTPDSEHLELAAVAALGTAADQITTVVDTSAYYDLRWQAIRAHSSQASPYDVMPRDLQREFLATDRLRRVRPAWTGGPVETDFLG